jgi:FecR protein
MRALSRVPLLMAALTSILAASPALAQTAPAGIVTAVHGTATIARAANNQTGPLRFKDDVFLYDRVTTGERSLARILLGGRAVVTARERSTLTITAVPGAATLDLESGRLLLAVAKGAMRPGESIDIKTRNAVIGIRGTVVVADFVPGEARDGSGDATVFTILTGAVEVTQIDPLAAHSVGTPLRLGALQSVKLMGTRLPEVKTISAEQAKRMTQGFAVPIRLTPETSKQVADMHAAKVERELTDLLAPPPTSNSGTSNGTVSGGTGVVTGVTGAVSGVTGAATGTVSGVTGAVTGTVSGVTGALVGPTGILTPTPAPTQTATSNPSSAQRNSGGLLGGLLKTTGSLLK